MFRTLEPYLLSALLPGAGHMRVGRTGVGVLTALVWTLLVHVVLHGTWVVPKMFPAWGVPAAWVGLAAIWLWALISLARGPAARADRNS